MDCLTPKIKAIRCSETSVTLTVETYKILEDLNLELRTESNLAKPGGLITYKMCMKGKSK